MFLKSSKESNLEYTAKYLETHFVTYLLAMSLSFGFFILLFNLFIDLFLSEFKNSLELMKVLFLGYLFYSTTTITSDVLNVGDKHLRRLTILLLGIAVNTILVFYLSIQNNYGLLGIAWSSTIGLFVLSLLFIFFAFELAGLNKFDIFVFILKNSFISVSLFLVITNLLDLEISN